MKKKIFYLLSFIVACSTVTFAQNQIDYRQLAENTPMPTDEEIMQTISKYNFDKEQQEHLFRETKKRLEDLYKNKNYSQLLQPKDLDKYNQKMTQEQEAQAKEAEKSLQESIKSIEESQARLDRYYN